MEGIRIVDAAPDDAVMIADAILSAVGEEIVDRVAGSHSRDDVREIFRRLAAGEESQYSFRNTRIAVMPDGRKAGVCISYDGGRLIELRRSFFREANRTLGWNMTAEEIDSAEPETTPDEFYLDTLATLPEFRHRGVATALILDARRRAEKAGLPLGLLVADDNPKARQLYESIGFRPVARRPFAGEIMTNLRLS